jgi:hypothetical protein
VQRVTDAPEPLAVDQARRARSYLTQMGVRVVCFLLAVLLWTHVPLWVSIALMVGAVVLPYTAVLFANAGRERRDPAPPGVPLHLLDGAAPSAAPPPAPPTPTAPPEPPPAPRPSTGDLR